jgi:cytoskeletal protein CcmA (bactofilin family)
VRKQLLICATGKVSGKIRYGKLTIEEGGEISGDIAAITDSGKGARTDSSRNNAAVSSALPALARPGT